MNVNKVLVFKSNEAKKQNSSNKPGDFTTKFIPELNLEDNQATFYCIGSYLNVSKLV